MTGNVHRGITPLVFVILSVGEESLLRDDQEAFDGATSLTPAMMRAAQRKCPAISANFDKFERLLICYIKAGQRLFTTHCLYFIEVNHIRQELMMMYRRNLGHLPENTIAGLIWDIVTDASQFSILSRRQRSLMQRHRKTCRRPLLQYGAACFQPTSMWHQ